MVQLDRFEIILNNAEEAYFAGQEITGKVILEVKEPKKVNEILLELKGRARTYWTKHSGKSRKHCSHSEPYFLEQFNTGYTHKFTITNEGKEKERILPAGVHEVPFSYTLPKSLPSSFEGEFGYIRYTCKATCERPWDFDIVTRKAFTVVGIEDINSEPKLNEPVSTSDSSHAVAFCCRSSGSITAELSLSKTGYTPGENIIIRYRVNNNGRKTLPISLRLVQQSVYKAKTFAGNDESKNTSKVLVKVDGVEVPSRTSSEWREELITVPSVPPRLGKCKILSLNYVLEMEVDQAVTLRVPLVIGSIPLLSDLLNHSRQRNGEKMNGQTPRSPPTNGEKNGRHKSSMKDSPKRSRDQQIVQVTVTDECGVVMDDDDGEMEALLSARKRVRMPSSILSELYPTLPSPYYRESVFGPSDISDEKETAQYGSKLFAPKYPFYTE